jgi:hypothetical protein
MQDKKLLHRFLFVCVSSISGGLELFCIDTVPAIRDPSHALRMTFDNNKKESRSIERLSVNLLSYNKLLP